MFKNANQRRMLFAQDAAKKKGLDPSFTPRKTSTSISSSPGLPTPEGIPSPAKMGLSSPTASPNVIPALPPMPKMARFAKTRKYLKRSF
jgi:hypothetical protein